MVWWNNQIILTCTNLSFYLKYCLHIYLYLKEIYLCIPYNEGWTFDLEGRD